MDSNELDYNLTRKFEELLDLVEENEEITENNSTKLIPIMPTDYQNYHQLPPPSISPSILLPLQFDFMGQNPLVKNESIGYKDMHRMVENLSTEYPTNNQMRPKVNDMEFIPDKMKDHVMKKVAFTVPNLEEMECGVFRKDKQNKKYGNKVDTQKYQTFDNYGSGASTSTSVEFGAQAVSSEIVDFDLDDINYQKIGFGPDSSVQNNSISLITYFHHLYSGLTLLANDRKFIRELLIPHEIVLKVVYESPDTNHIMTHVKFLYDSITGERKMMDELFKIVKNFEIDSSLINVSNILLRDFGNQMMKLSKFNCYTPSTHDDLLLLLKTLYTYVRYSSINYMLVKRTIRNKGKTVTREARRNIGR